LRWEVPAFQKGVCMNIYVGNLTLGITEAELRQEFAPFGEVLSIIIMDDTYIGSGQPTGYGFVEMASKSEGAAAIAGLRGKRLRSREIEVVEALPLDKSGVSSFAPKSRFHSKVRQRK
jgi:RNA recognition motif-containing protein